LDPQASRKIAEILGQVYEEVAQAVTKKEFNEYVKQLREEYLKNKIINQKK